tara:strand:+ start:1714 stop:2463 length:750 start_codon:yes stop_codon:yes gene_type:complete
MNGLIKEINELGIISGDCILIHSNIVKLLRKFDSKDKRIDFIDKFIESLLRKVGPLGTLVFPVFTFSFSNKGYASFKDLECETGILSKRVLLLNDGARSFSPVYSFTSIGNLSKSINSASDLTPFRPNSVFDILEKANSKILIINVSDNNSLTYVHYVESQIDIPYRKYKKFTGKIETISGQINTYTELFVRSNNNIKTDISDLQYYLEKSKIYNCTDNTRIISMKEYKRECLNLLDLKKYSMFRKITN